MTTPHIALVRKSGHYMLALVRVGADNRLWATGADGKPFRISPPQLVWETEIAVGDVALAAWLTEAERMVSEVDAAEAWDILVDEVPGLSLEDLAGLACEQPVTDAQQAGLLLGLFTGDVQRFTAEPPSLRPRSRDDVERQLARLAERQQSAAEEAGFAAWLSGAARTVLTERQHGWLNTVVQYVAEGENSTAARAAKGWLRPIAAGPDARQVAFDLLAARGVLDADEFLTLRRLGQPTAFSAEELAAAGSGALAATDVDVGRRDLTELEVFTIDEATTVDIDDGLSVLATDDGFEVGVHIVDAAALVAVDGMLDDAARARMTSLYLPEGTLPMLPRALSEERGSLVAGVDRRAVSLLTRWSREHELLEWELCRSTVRSRRRWTYSEADAALAGGGQDGGEPLRTLRAIADTLHGQRMAAGALEMDRPEVKVSVDGERNMSVTVTPVPTPARRMVAEFMVLANRLIGERLRDLGVAAVYRTQDAVSLEDVPDTSVEAVRQYHILRQIRPARLTTSAGAHALIGVEPYVQATSPLRRYLDLVVQRQLVSALTGSEAPYSEGDLKTLIGEADATLRDLNRAEDERKRHWMLRHLSGRIGESFPAVVLDVRERQSVVELQTYLIRSNVYLPPSVAPGQTVMLELQEVDTWRGQTRWRHAG
ncbi:MAG: ribonuclease catalytic domain-containing protein [Chloroflexota bacterium]|nr:ribonuclease catalytic domain-containing protein [Chloroflexota bacterium]